MTSARAGAADHPFRSLLGAAAIALVLLVGFAGLRGWGELAEARARRERLETSLEETRRRIEALERRSRELTTSPAALERLAREELGMVRPGEIVLMLEPARGAAAAAEVSPPAEPPPPPAASRRP